MNPMQKILARMAELKPLIEELAAVEGDLTPEQRTTWTETTTEWSELEARKADLEERQAMAERAAKVTYRPAVPGMTDPHEIDERSLRNGGAELRSKAATIVERTKHIVRGGAESVTKLLEHENRSVADYAAKLVMVTDTDAYRSAFTKYLTGASPHAYTSEESQALQRAWSHTTTAVGAVIPWTLDPSLIVTGAGSSNPMRQLATVKQIGPTRDGWNGATVAQVTAGYLGAGSAFSDNSPATTVPNIPVYKWGAWIEISFEAFEDAEGLASDVVMLFADARDNLEATYFVTGTGSSQPTGCVYAAGAVTASRVSPTTGGSFGLVDVYAVHEALPARHRIGAPADQRSWLADVAVINDMRQFGTSNNYHGFLADLGAGQPPQLLGDQLNEASAMSSSITTGQDVLLYGAFNKYYIIDRIGMSVEFVPNLVDGSGMPTGERGWLVHGRHGGNAVDADAFRVLRL